MIAAQQHTQASESDEKLQITIPTSSPMITRILILVLIGILLVLGSYVSTVFSQINPASAAKDDSRVLV